MTIEDETGETWAVPLVLVARSYARAYEEGHGASPDKALEATWWIFDDDPTEALQWARGDMNWGDVEEYAVKVAPAEEIDKQMMWIRGDRQICSREAIAEQFNLPAIGDGAWWLAAKAVQS
ncbi:MAG: hypothetical protein AAGM22_27770 [Acidobacteriota bacterium]